MVLTSTPNYEELKVAKEIKISKDKKEAVKKNW